MSATYSSKPASAVAVGDRVRPLAAIGPSVPRGGEWDDHPYTVISTYRVDAAGNIRIYAHPEGSRVSTTSPALYGVWGPNDPIEVAQ